MSFIRVSFVALITLVPTLAFAQPVGTFRWQMQPYCNVVTVSITRTENVYSLDGFDDQCGAGTHALTTGSAMLNPDGTVEMGLNIVTAPADGIALRAIQALEARTRELATSLVRENDALKVELATLREQLEARHTGHQPR